MSTWKINLSGTNIPVYSLGFIGPATTQVGNVTRNECFVESVESLNPYEGDGTPINFLNSSHTMTDGFLVNSYNNLVDFTAYASNGTSWVSVSTLERKVQYATVAYYSDGTKCCDLPAGSKVYLKSTGAAGTNNRNYIAVTKVITASGTPYTFSSGDGYVDLTYNNRWINVGSILLRKV